MNNMKGMARSFGVLFAIALIIAVIGRIGLGVMSASGALAYDYISASGVAILDVICSILTGSAFVAFLFAAGLALSLSTAGSVLYGFLYWRDTPGTGKPLTAFLWGWATALVAIVCLVIVASGILSAVQVGSMSSKLPGTFALIVGVIVFAAFLGTLLGAASQVVCACIACARKTGKLGVRLIVATAVCGVIVMILTVGTFSALNRVAIDLGVLGVWFVVDALVNIAIMAGVMRIGSCKKEACAKSAAA